MNKKKGIPKWLKITAKVIGWIIMITSMAIILTPIVPAIIFGFILLLKFIRTCQKLGEYEHQVKQRKILDEHFGKLK